MKILLAVSGGIDSMYLANRSLEDAGGLFGLDTPLSFAVAHCNFALRGEESDGDELFVRSWCDAHGIRCFVRRFDTAGFAAKRHISIEMAAREMRYEWFRELASSEGYDKIAVAHNKNDNAETLILNLLRGTGLQGMTGMSADGDFILRPMLDISRNNIQAWMQDRGFTWREDHTNSENIYKRNILRNEVFPIFERINPSFLDALSRGMKNFAQASAIADEYFIDSGIDSNEIDIQKLRESRHWKYLLFRLTEGRLTRDQLDDIGKMIDGGEWVSGKRFGHYVTTSSGKLLLDNADNCSSTYEWDILERRIVTNLKQENTLFLDADLMPDGPVFRHWKEGDWMTPLGMKGKKKLSDIFNDIGLSIPEKKRLWLVEYPSEEARIAAIECGRIDDSLKVTDKTKRILRIKFNS